MAQTQMTLSAGILGLAFGQIIAGPSSDAFGRRRPLLIGLAAFALASLLCVIAPSIEVLTLLRFVQGFAGAAGIAIALAVVSDLYTGTTQARFFSLLMQISGLAPIVAPIIGSQVLVYTSWRGVFVVLALIGVGLFLAAAFALGETLPTERRQNGGMGATLGAFRALLGDRRFMSYALATGFAFAAGISYISSAPFILQNLYGLSPQLLGVVFAVNAIGIVIAAQVNGRFVGRIPPLTLLTWGGSLIAVSGASLLVAVLSNVGLVGILPAFFLMTFSFGLIVPNATTLALADTPAAGSAAGLLGVLQLVIGAAVAPLVGMGGTESALPLAIAIATFGLATLLTVLVSRRPDRAIA
jgi:MFS transporter, DHA1 family, multidrug resistance protein